MLISGRRLAEEVSKMVNAGHYSSVQELLADVDSRYDAESKFDAPKKSYSINLAVRSALRAAARRPSLRSSRCKFWASSANVA